jgi:hypothetical protein
MIKYVWFNVASGEFSNSWTPEDYPVTEKQLLHDMDIINCPHMKLIKYECVSDENFEFYDLMRIITNT